MAFCSGVNVLIIDLSLYSPFLQENDYQGKSLFKCLTFTYPGEGMVGNELLDSHKNTVDIFYM